MDQKNTKYHCKSGLYFHIIGTQLETIYADCEIMMVKTVWNVRKVFNLSW